MRRLIVVTVLGGLLLCAVGVLYALGLRGLSAEARQLEATSARSRLQALEAVRDALRASLEELRQRESQRPYYEYNALYAPPDLVSNTLALVPSPLRKPQPGSLIALHFVARDGEFDSPLLFEPAQGDAAWSQTNASYKALEPTAFALCQGSLLDLARSPELQVCFDTPAEGTPDRVDLIDPFVVWANGNNRAALAKVQGGCSPLELADAWRASQLRVGKTSGTYAPAQPSSREAVVVRIFPFVWVPSEAGPDGWPKRLVALREVREEEAGQVRRWHQGFVLDLQALREQVFALALATSNSDPKEADPRSLLSLTDSLGGATPQILSFKVLPDAVAGLSPQDAGSPAPSPSGSPRATPAPPLGATPSPYEDPAQRGTQTSSPSPTYRSTRGQEPSQPTEGPSTATPPNGETGRLGYRPEPSLSESPSVPQPAPSSQGAAAPAARERFSSASAREAPTPPKVSVVPSSSREAALRVRLHAPLDGLALVDRSEGPAVDEVLSGSRRLLQGAVILALSVLACGTLLLLSALRGERRLARQRADFVAALTHELKAPLTGLRALAELLHDGLVPDEAKRHEYYASMLDESERLSRLVQNVLDAARLEGGALRVDLERLDPGPFLAGVTERFRARLEAQGFALDVDLGDEDLPELLVDREACTQILANLLDNAAKYGRGSERRIDVRARPTLSTLQVSVSDHGPGIPAKQREQIFERFYRSEDAPREVGGAGLGLAIARAQARSQGGELRVVDAPLGATFCLELPYADGPLDPSQLAELLAGDADPAGAPDDTSSDRTA